MDIFTLIKLPDFFTLGSVACGIFSIVSAYRGNFALAAILLLAAAFLDWLDGEVAGLIKRQGLFGAELDSLADVISFGVAPIFFAYFMGLNDILAIIILILFTCASVLRLARFSVIKTNSFFYLGLPTTANAILLPLLYLGLYLTNVPWGISRWIYLVYFLVSAILMDSTVPIPTFKIFTTFEGRALFKD